MERKKKKYFTLAYDFVDEQILLCALQINFVLLNSEGYMYSLKVSDNHFSNRLCPFTGQNVHAYGGKHLFEKRKIPW